MFSTDKSCFLKGCANEIFNYIKNLKLKNIVFICGDTHLSNQKMIFIFSPKYKSSLYNRFDVYFFYNSWFHVPAQTDEYKRVHKSLDLHSMPCNLQVRDAKKCLKTGAHKIVGPYYFWNCCNHDYVDTFQ